LRIGSTLPCPPDARNPFKYCRGLVRAIEQRGGRFHSRSAYVGHEETDRGVIVRLENGRTIHADAVLFATNSPVNDLVKVHTKQVPMRTYAMAAEVPEGASRTRSPGTRWRPIIMCGFSRRVTAWNG